MKKITTMLVLGFFLVLGVFVQSAPANAATVSKNADVYTIRYFLDNNGTEKDWVGSRADAQKIIGKEDAKRLSALKLALKNKSNRTNTFEQDTKVSGYASPQLDRVGNCIWPNTYLIFWNSGPLVCFANSGSQSVGIYSVYRVDAGNNSGSFYANQGPAGTYIGWICLAQPIRYGKNQTLYPPPNDVWDITNIYNN